MKNLIFNYLLVLAIGGIAAYLFTPVAEALALKAGAVDHPTARKVHVRPVPRLGGLAIYVSFLLAIAAQFVWQSVFPGEPLLNPSRSLIGIALGGTFILLLGLVDDFADLSPVVKFLLTAPGGLSLTIPWTLTTNSVLNPPAFLTVSGSVI